MKKGMGDKSGIKAILGLLAVLAAVLANQHAAVAGAGRAPDPSVKSEAMALAAVERSAKTLGLGSTPTLRIVEGDAFTAWSRSTVFGSTIAVSGEMLQKSAPEDVGAVIAHEAGHAANGDTLRRMFISRLSATSWENDELRADCSGAIVVGREAMARAMDRAEAELGPGPGSESDPHPDIGARSAFLRSGGCLEIAKR